MAPALIARVNKPALAVVRERQQAGIEEAKKAGVYKGRKPSVPVAKVRGMQAEGHGPSAIAKALGIRRMSVHRALSRT